jgi:PAS domain S-box-containing protein
MEQRWTDDERHIRAGGLRDSGHPATPDIPVEVLERFLTESVDGLLAFDLGGAITVWNPGMERLSGIRTAEAIGKPLNVFPPLHSGDEPRHVREVLDGRVTVSKRVSVPEYGRFVDIYYFPVRSETGDLAGAAAILRDVTETGSAGEAEIPEMARLVEALWAERKDQQP